MLMKMEEPILINIMVVMMLELPPDPLETQSWIQMLPLIHHPDSSEICSVNMVDMEKV